MCIRFTTQTKKVYKWYHSIRKPLDHLYQARNKTICVELFYKRRRSKCLLHSDLFVVRGGGLEPPLAKRSLEPESSASANSATLAFILAVFLTAWLV